MKNQKDSRCCRGCDRGSPAGQRLQERESGAESPTKRVEETTTAVKAEPAAPESPRAYQEQQGQNGRRERVSR